MSGKGNKSYRLFTGNACIDDEEDEDGSMRKVMVSCAVDREFM